MRIFLKNSDVHWGWLLLRGILGVLAGGYVIANPLMSALVVPTTLALIMGIQGIIMGVAGLIEAFKGGGWGAGLLGAINIFLGVVLVSNPVLAAFILPWVLGIFGVVFGIVTIIASFRLRSAA
ncbi:MAG: hypothetical protein Kow0031_28870 [Anaerolineae bacterium]